MSSIKSEQNKLEIEYQIISDEFDVLDKKLIKLCKIAKKNNQKISIMPNGNVLTLKAVDIDAVTAGPIVIEFENDRLDRFVITELTDNDFYLTDSKDTFKVSKNCIKQLYIILETNSLS